MVAEDNILTTPYTITFVADELKKHYNRPDATLQSNEVKRIGVGEGFCSIIAKIKLTWKCDADNLPQTVILKVPSFEGIQAMMTENPDMKEMMDEEMVRNFKQFFIQMHNNECAMYMHFGQLNQQLCIPLVYSCKQMDQVDQPGYILMEDLSHLYGGAIVNNADGLTLTQAKMVAQTMARFYAHVLMCKDKSWMTCAVVPKQTIENFKKMDEYGYKPLQSFAPGRFPDELLKKLDFMRTDAYMHEMYFPKDTLKTVGIPLGLVHGDLWTNNMMFSDDRLVAIIDWQTLHVGNVMEDMCRLLVSSCAPSVLQEHRDEILELYYSTVEKEFGTQLSFTVTDLKRAFDFAMPFAMQFYAMSVAFIGESPAIVGLADDPKRATRKEALVVRAEKAIDYCSKEEIIANYHTVIAKHEDD